MDKVEYSDLNKFLVSLGLALMFASVGVLWLFLREPFDLGRTAEELHKLTPLAQHVLQERQEWVARTLRFLPLASVIGMGSGALFLVYGLWRWIPQQRELERIQTLTRRKLEKEVEPMLPAEVQERARAQVVQDPTLVSAAEAIASSPADAVRRATEELLVTEAEVIDRLAERLPSRFELLAHRKFGHREVDLVIRSTKTDQDALFFVEIKVFTDRSSARHLKEAFDQISQAVNWYNLTELPPALPMVLALVPAVSGSLVEAATRAIESTKDNPTAYGSTLVRVIARHRLRTLSSREMDQVLDPTQRLVVLAESEKGE